MAEGRYRRTPFNGGGTTSRQRCIPEVQQCEAIFATAVKSVHWWHREFFVGSLRKWHLSEAGGDVEQQDSR